MPNYSPRADHDTVTNCNPAQNTNASADPHVRPDMHWRRYARLFIDPTFGTSPMVVIRHKTARRDHCMISNDNGAADIKFSPGAQIAKISNLNACHI
jgi:hypothetical protein